MWRRGREMKRSLVVATWVSLAFHGLSAYVMSIGFDRLKAMCTVAELSVELPTLSVALCENSVRVGGVMQITWRPVSATSHLVRFWRLDLLV